MKKAKDAGMVVLNVQNTVTDEESYDYYVGPDDTAAARQAASLLMNALPDGGKIVMVEGTRVRLARSTGQRVLKLLFHSIRNMRF